MTTHVTNLTVLLGFTVAMSLFLMLVNIKTGRSWMLKHITFTGVVLGIGFSIFIFVLIAKELLK